MFPNLQLQAACLAQRLAQAEKRIVFAESCTGGLASAALAGIAGISQWHCGSAVTYRPQTKIDWLGVSKGVIDEAGIVSEEVAREMAAGALARTREADLAAAVTGHLGPDAPAQLDGIVIMAVVETRRDAAPRCTSWRHALQATTRTDRQTEAAALLLQHVWQSLAIP